MPRCHVSTRAHLATKVVYDAIKKARDGRRPRLVPGWQERFLGTDPKKDACDTMTIGKLLSGPAKTAMLAASKEININRFGGRARRQQEGK